MGSIFDDEDDGFDLSEIEAQHEMTEMGALPSLTHSAHFFWQSCPQYVKRSQFLYVVHINILSVCHIPLYIPRLWLNG